jgi:hypothetical protein
MKTLRLFGILLVGLTLFGDQPRVPPRFRTVYIREMTNALDQHLASRIYSTHVLWVVLDPAGADAVLTDSVDESFWLWMQRTYPSAKTNNADTTHLAATDTASARKHLGTVFLVDPRQRLILWSTYELPKKVSPADLDRTATRITDQLRAALQ